MGKVSNVLPASFPDMEASCHKVGYLPLHSVDFRILRAFQLAHRNKFVSGLKSQFFNVTSEGDHKPSLAANRVIWTLTQIIVPNRKFFSKDKHAVLLRGPDDPPTHWNKIPIYLHFRYEAFREKVRERASSQQDRNPYEEKLSKHGASHECGGAVPIGCYTRVLNMLQVSKSVVGRRVL